MTDDYQEELISFKTIVVPQCYQLGVEKEGYRSIDWYVLVQHVFCFLCVCVCL